METPFIFGSQYYRAPTPERECWNVDFTNMKRLGFSSVKFFLQWRWSHRFGDKFVFDDLDALMDLAGKHNLSVTLNFIFDVSPTWLFEKYPDAKQINALGQIIEPYAVSHRYIGGHPGPCYNHQAALKERKHFLEVAVNHFKNHPAMGMWDVWNEPELSFQQRQPDLKTLVCYCPNCRDKFIDWLKAKYCSLENLNNVWGKCYEDWRFVETPRYANTIIDFVDWREFHLDTLTQEAKWRLEMVKRIDSSHPAYLHVVPNTMTCFCSVTCADDFALAENCDVFAGSLNDPAGTCQILSAARGKICYNVESHINFGGTFLHQPIIELKDVLRSFLPQIGMGLRGILFWQYRPEIAGAEAPAWGLVNLDGTSRAVTKAVKVFWEKISPFSEQLLACPPMPAEIGIWKSRKNEIFSYAVFQELQTLSEAIVGYTDILYWNNYKFRFVNETALEAGELENLKLLIMPSPYYMTDAEVAQLDNWVRQGGVLLTDAHLAGYSATRGRHSRVLPGGGLAESWGIREVETTSSYHMDIASGEVFGVSASDDVNKAVKGWPLKGGRYFPIELTNGKVACGACRFAKLEADFATCEGLVGDAVCIVSKKIGKGHVIYCGTNLGEGAKREKEGIWEIFKKAAEIAHIKPSLNAMSDFPNVVHVDSIENNQGVNFIIIHNKTENVQNIRLDVDGTWKGLFTNLEFKFKNNIVSLSGDLIDIFVRE